MRFKYYRMNLLHKTYKEAMNYVRRIERKVEDGKYNINYKRKSVEKPIKEQ
jgi:hypothetical protein